MGLKLQSSTELVTTYGIVMFLVALAIIIVVVLVSAPPAVIPKSCSIYGGLQCADIAYGSNTLGGSILLVRASFAVPGTLNVSSFGAVVGGVKSTSGFCTTNGVVTGPTTISEGSSILCVAYFPSSSSPSPYAGTFNVSANYCTGPSSSTCPGTHNYQFAGSWSTQGAGAITSNYIHEIALNASTTTTVKGANHYVPITLTNSQNGNAASPFQQLVYFNPSTYSSYEASNLGNLRFYAGPTELDSWCERGCNNTGSNAVFWVALSPAVPALSSIVINMTFLSTSTNFDGVIAGENPTQSITGYQLASQHIGYTSAQASDPTGDAAQAYPANATAPLYICAGALNSHTGGGGLYTDSLGANWNPDVQDGDAYITAIGVNYTTGCTTWSNSYNATAGSPPYDPVVTAAISISGYTTYSLYTRGSGGQAADTYLNFNVNTNNAFVVIAAACGYDSCDGMFGGGAVSILGVGGGEQIPSNCTRQQLADYDGYETAEIYTCELTPAGSPYTVDVNNANGDAEMAAAAYVFQNVTPVPIGYSKYDNGPNVFSFYASGANSNGWSGAGTAGALSTAPTGTPFGTNALWASGADQSDYITINTGLGTSGNYIIQYYMYATIGDFYMFANVPGTGMMTRYEGRGFAGSGFGTTSCYSPACPAGPHAGQSGWHSPEGSGTLTGNQWYMFEIARLQGTQAGDWQSSTLNYEAPLTNINPLATTFTQGDGPIPGNVANSTTGSYFSLRGDTISNPTYLNGLIVRQYPPNGIMPSISVGTFH